MSPLAAALSSEKTRSRTASTPAKVLVVDDDMISRQVLRGLLTSHGYSVMLAGNGLEALEQVHRDPPDLVFMDLFMPGMDGFETAWRIKQQQQQFMPIVFLTAEQSDQVLAKCLAAGGDDVVSKPYSFILLKAKMEALLRTRRLYNELQAQQQALAIHEERRQEEFRLAERIYSRITRTSRLRMGNVKYLLKPIETFSGDLILAAVTPSGGQQFLVGDFSGHGLPAAIGAMVVFDVFYSMTAKGFSIGRIVQEINLKLLEILPTGHFLSACLIELSPDHQIATVWNGGLPPVYVRGDEAGGQAVIQSTHLPLGVVPGHVLDVSATVLSVSQGNRIVVYSDGVIEARNRQGEMYSDERLQACFHAVQDATALFDRIVGDLQGFVGDAPQYDDICLLEITCDPALAGRNSAQDQRCDRARTPTNWKLSLGLCANALREMDPLPSILQLVTEIQGLHPHRERLYTVLAELYSNALEHGILGLDSQLKHSPDGFAKYYQQRQEALNRLSEGAICMEFQHAPAPEGGGRLILRVTHTGKGFDYHKIPPEFTGNTGFCGRGIPLVRILCDKVTYMDEGKEVEAVYLWT